MSEQEPDSYGLVMPFVVVASRGGSFDDQSFVAGYQAGQIDLELRAGKGVAHTVPTDLVTQIDLIAMANGYVMNSHLWEDDPFWTMVTFKRPRDSDEYELLGT